MKQKLIEKKKNSEIIEENGRALDSVCDIYVVNKVMKLRNCLNNLQMSNKQRF